MHSPLILWLAQTCLIDLLQTAVVLGMFLRDRILVNARGAT